MAHKVITSGTNAETREFTDWAQAHAAATAIWSADGLDAARLAADYTLFEDLAGYVAALNASAHFLQANPQDGHWISSLTEDLSYWADGGITTPAEMAHDLAAETYHNVYKSATGIRPRRDLSALTPEQIDALTHEIAEMDCEDY